MCPTVFERVPFLAAASALALPEATPLAVFRLLEGRAILFQGLMSKLMSFRANSKEEEAGMEYTKERAMEWLNKNWHNPKACPICKQNNWAISESLALIPRLVQERI